MTPLAFLPKIKSKALRKSAKGQPCTLRISSFIPGHSCAGDDTVVLCHLEGIGGGMAGKTSDLDAAFGCAHCHALIDHADNRIEWIVKTYPIAFAARLLRAKSETQARWVEMDLLRVPGGEIR